MTNIGSSSNRPDLSATLHIARRGQEGKSDEVQVKLGEGVLQHVFSQFKGKDEAFNTLHTRAVTWLQKVAPKSLNGWEEVLKTVEEAKALTKKEHKNGFRMALCNERGERAEGIVEAKRGSVTHLKLEKKADTSGVEISCIPRKKLENTPYLGMARALSGIREKIEERIKGNPEDSGGFTDEELACFALNVAGMEARAEESFSSHIDSLKSLIEHPEELKEQKFEQETAEFLSTLKNRVVDQEGSINDQRLIEFAANVLNPPVDEKIHSQHREMLQSLRDTHRVRQFAGSKTEEGETKQFVQTGFSEPGSDTPAIERILTPSTSDESLAETSSSSSSTSASPVPDAAYKTELEEKIRQRRGSTEGE